MSSNNVLSRVSDDHCYLLVVPLDELGQQRRHRSRCLRNRNLLINRGPFSQLFELNSSAKTFTEVAVSCFAVRVIGGGNGKEWRYVTVNLAMVNRLFRNSSPLNQLLAPCNVVVAETYPITGL